MGDRSSSSRRITSRYVSSRGSCERYSPSSFDNTISTGTAVLKWNLSMSSVTLRTVRCANPSNSRSPSSSGRFETSPRKLAIFQTRSRNRRVPSIPFSFQAASSVGGPMKR